MKLFRSSLPRAAVLALVCLMTVSVSAQAENPLTNISGRIKNGVSNVGNAIKKTAKAAKNIVTPGKAPEEKPVAPRPAPNAGAPKKSSTTAAANPSAKTKKSAPTASAAKPASESPPKPKAKPTTGSVPVSASKTKPKAKTQLLAGDSDDKPKTRKKATVDASRDEENSKTASVKKKRVTGDPAPENEVAKSQEAAAPMAAAPGSVESAPAAGDAPQAEQLPFGTPAFGRKGFVYSPYAPDQGLIDVKSVAAGAKVRCPYTGKVFRVP